MSKPHCQRQTQRRHLGGVALLLGLSLRLSNAQTPVPAPVEPGLALPPPAYRKDGPAHEVAPRAEGDGVFSPAAVSPLQRYSIGEPTPEEQLYLEYINRARADPPAEAIRLRDITDPEVISACRAFNVDLNLMVAQISGLAAFPPLSFNSNLLAAARAHTADQFVNTFQGHLGTDGSSPAERVTRTGYAWTALGENTFASAKSVLHGHAGFEVDWGAGVGGMQTPPGHRYNIHGGSYREVGIGVTNGQRGSVGPQLVTQDFGTRPGLTPFVTGVAYFDFNGNQSYDVGEGIGGVTVNVTGSAWYAVTAQSGGYSVPASGDGTFTVTFTASNLPPSARTVTVSGGKNVKVDYLAPYSPPQITGSTTPTVNRVNFYTFTPVGAATGYQWRQSTRVPAAATEGAESGLVNFTTRLSTNYAVVQGDVRASGTAAFRLAHPQPVDQVVALNWVIRPSTSGQLTWANRLTWATSNQVARVQVTTNSGITWQDLWTLPGSGNAGQTAFVRPTVSLAAFAGSEIQVRFLYDHLGGSYYNQTSAGIGWHFDDIGFNHCEQLIDSVVREVTGGTSFGFTPAAPTNYALTVRARVGDRLIDWGPALLATASGTTPPVIRITSMPSFSGDRTLFNFTVSGGDFASFTVERAPAPNGPWQADGSAIITTVVAGSQYRASCATGTSRAQFFRIAGR